MSGYEQVGRLSPAPFYHHSSPSDAIPPVSLSFMLGPPRAQVHQQTNPGPPSSSKQPDDTYYIAKYKDMKRKVKEMELDNDRLHLKCLKARKSIQRLRIERAILYESLSTMPVAELNVTPVASSKHSDVHPYPSPDLAHGHQEHYHQLPFSPDEQARTHPDQSRTPSEAVHLARSQHQRIPMQGVDPHRPPHRLHDNPSPIGHHHSGVLMLGASHPNTKPRQRKPKVDIKNAKTQPFSSNTHHEVRNGGSRTFPFVHEYSSAQEQVESVFAPQEYPSEIRFHQYEGLSERRPVNRSRRDIDRDNEKGIKHKRRPLQEVEKDRQHHPRSRSSSPTGPSNHGKHAFPIQNPFTSVERDSQPGPAQEDDREPSVTITQPVVPSDESSQQHNVEARFSGTRSDETSIRHEHLAEEEGEKTRDSAWQPSEKKNKRAHLEVDLEDRYARKGDERDDCNRTQRRLLHSVVRDDDLVYSLPHVREGEVMD